MKNIKLILFILSGVFANAQKVDSLIIDISRLKIYLKGGTCCESRQKQLEGNIGYYVLNYSDTIYFTNYSILLNCINPTAIINNPLNRCAIVSFGNPISGVYSDYRVVTDSLISTFQGTLKEGHYLNGFYSEFYSNGSIKVTGQVNNGWRFGFWTYYFQNGQMSDLNKYILNAPYPVTQWEYNSDGTLEYYNDESLEIEKRIRDGY